MSMWLLQTSYTEDITIEYVLAQRPVFETLLPLNWQHKHRKQNVTDPVCFARPMWASIWESIGEFIAALLLVLELYVAALDISDLPSLWAKINRTSQSWVFWSWGDIWTLENIHNSLNIKVGVEYSRLCSIVVSL